MQRWSLRASIGILLLGCGGPVEPSIDVASMAREVLYAPHGSVALGFFTPWSEDPKTVGGMLRWAFSSNPHREAKRADPSAPRIANDGAYLSGADPGATVTWVGHATFAVHDGDDVFLTDPHFGARALVLPRLVEPGVPLESIPADAFAVVSHNHYDHLDVETVEALPASVTWYVGLGMAEWFRERGRDNVVEFDWWQSHRRGRWTITCLPSQHWSRRIEQSTNQALWCAWLLDSGSRRYFHAGDTGYFHGFKAFGERFPGVDVAMLPIGAYEPRWFMKWQHMNPAEAYQAYLDLGAGTLLGMHWGTFDLTDEPADLPPRVLAEVVRERDGDPARVRTLAVGERWRVPERAVSTKGDR